MKNIHVLPTDKPSRLSKHIYFSGLVLTEDFFAESIGGNITQHIYITSDEEIKEGDWCYDKVLNFVFQTDNQTCFKYANQTYNVLKIILTTDQDLIKDGVQAIDDEFLEWFVKNPSCECVDVNDWLDDKGNIAFNGKLRYQICNHLYDKIIIPKEETKKETFTKPDTIDGQWLSPIPSERQWQEEQLVNIFEHYPNASPKWQYMNGLIQNSLDARKMYSEEELRNAMNWTLTQYFEFHECPTTHRMDHYVQSIKSE